MKNFVYHFLLFFEDYAYLVYKIFTIAALLSFGLVLYYIFNARTEMLKKKRGLVFLFICTFVMLTIIRLPQLTIFELNPDESEWLTHTNTLFADPLIWFKYFQPRLFARIGTILPLICWQFFSGPLDYADARVVSWLCWSLFLVFYFLTIRRILGQKLALIAFYLLFSIIALFVSPDFTAYNSEIPTLALLMICIFLIIRVVEKKAYSPGYSFAAGFTMVLAVFTKEQVFPLAASMGLFFMFFLFLKKSKEAFPLVLFFGSGIMAAVSLNLLPYFVFNTLNELLLAITNIIEYSDVGLWGKRPYFVKVQILINYLFNRDFRFLSFPVTLISTYLLFAITRKNTTFTSRQKKYFYWFLAIALASIFIIISPQDLFLHYTLFLLLPLGLFLPFCILFITSKISNPRLGVSLIAVFVTAAFVYGIIIQTNLNTFMNLESDFSKTSYLKMTPKIKAITRAGDRLAVWGWNSAYYVETGLPAGNRYIYPAAILLNWPSKEKLITRYLSDLKVFKPKIILEIIGPGQFAFTDTISQGIRNFPSINAYLVKNYQLLEQDGMEKLYVRKD